MPGSTERRKKSELTFQSLSFFLIIKKKLFGRSSNATEYNWHQLRYPKILERLYPPTRAGKHRAAWEGWILPLSPSHHQRRQAVPRPGHNSDIDGLCKTTQFLETKYITRKKKKKKKSSKISFIKSPALVTCKPHRKVKHPQLWSRTW